MARYDYRCPACELVFEVEHGMDEKPLVVCPACGHEAARVFEVSGIALKGSGFYNTDMRDGSSSKKTADRAKGSDAKESGSSSSGSTDGSGSSGSSTSEGSGSSDSSSNNTKSTD